MKLNVMKGSMPLDTPSLYACSLAASRSRFTLTSVSSDMMPAMFSRRSPSTWPFSTTVMPPCSCTMWLAAKAMSSSFVPTTMILWLSWLMLVATAPFFRP